MRGHMHQPTISHTNIQFNQATSSSHRKCGQGDHIESTSHPQSNMDSSHRGIQINELTDLADKEATKLQPAPLKPTPVSDLIDTLRKCLPRLEYILEKPASKEQTPTHETSAKPRVATPTLISWKLEIFPRKTQHIAPLIVPPAKSPTIAYKLGE